jgi:hypothetical protein
LQKVAANGELQKTLRDLSVAEAKEMELQPQLNRIRRPRYLDIEQGRTPPDPPTRDESGRGETDKTDPRFPEIIALEERLQELAETEDLPRIASWFITDARGVQLVRLPASDTTGRNFSWRTYFHGGVADYAETWRPARDRHIEKTQLSAAYPSESTKLWTVAVSSPVQTPLPESEFLGVVAVSFNVGRALFVLDETEHRFPVLADMREGGQQGLIVQHPLYYEVLPDERKRLQQHRLSPDEAHPKVATTENYRDPMRHDVSGQRFDKRWLAAQRPVFVDGKETGWVVVVQEAYEQAIGESLDQLRASFVSTGLITLLVVAIAIGVLWTVVVRMLSSTRLAPRSGGMSGGATPASP